MELNLINKTKITVLCGGWSAEREISLKTGAAVFESLKELNLNSSLMDLKSEQEALAIDSSIGLAYIALHGRGGEDGFIQRILEKKKIKYTGSSSSVCNLAMNKIEAKKVWIKEGLLTPSFLELSYQSAGEDHEEKGYGISSLSDAQKKEWPVVVKPCREGSSFGISIVKKHSRNLEEEIHEARKYDDSIIIESYIEGRELTVPILDQRALTPISIIPNSEFYDFHAKYERTDTQYVRSDLSLERTEEVKRLSLEAYNALGCKGWARVDLIESLDNNFYLIEINTVPGLTKTSLFPKSAALEDISFNQLILEMLKTA